MQEVGAVASSFSDASCWSDSLQIFWVEPITCVFLHLSELSATTTSSSPALGWAPLAQGPLQQGPETCVISQVATPPAPRSLYPKGRADSQPLLGSCFGQVLSKLRQALSCSLRKLAQGKRLQWCIPKQWCLVSKPKWLASA